MRRNHLLLTLLCLVVLVGATCFTACSKDISITGSLSSASIEVNATATISVVDNDNVAVTNFSAVAENGSTYVSISGNTITGVAATTGEKITISATVGNKTYQAEVTIAVTEPFVKQIESIAVTTQPTKTSYIEGETFDPTGMVVTATYNDDDTAVITNYSVPTTELGVEDTSVTVTLNDSTITTSVTISVIPKTIISIAVTTQPTKVSYTAGEVFDPTGMVVTATYNDDDTAVITNYSVPTTELEVEDTSVTVTLNDSTITANVSITVAPPPVKEFTLINTAAELLAFSAQATSDGNYRLNADIDCSGIDWTTAAVAFSGIFDGDGHTISGINFTYGSTNKSGMLFKTMEKAQLINIRFADISLTSAVEGSAIVAYSVVDSSFSNIEFSGCTVASTGNYACLLSSTATGTITIENITVKNNSTVSATKYSGIVIADTKAKSTVSVVNADISGTLTTTESSGVLMGRDRGNNTFNFEGIRFNVSINCATKCGLFISGDSAASTMTVKNCVVVGITYDANNATVSNCNPWIGHGGGITYTFTNCYYLTENFVYLLRGASADTTALVVPDGVYGVSKTLINQNWYHNTLALDFTDGWVDDGEDVIVKGATTNVVSSDAVLEELKLVTANVTTTYIEGDAFTSEGLVVKGIYTGGVEKEITSEEYELSSSLYQANVPGTYQINVSVGAISANYQVTVLAITGYKVYIETVPTVYFVDDDLDLTNLVVNFITADNEETKLNSSAYTVGSSAYVKSTPGTYAITIDYKEFAQQSFNVTVISAPLAVNELTNTVEFSVDGTYSGTIGAVDGDGRACFKTVTQLVNYLAGCEYAATVKKVVYISAGTYTEKINIPSSKANYQNLTFVGEVDTNGVPTTILSCGDYSGFVRFDGTPCGTDTSASVTIKAKNFSAINIAFENTYGADTSQALALLIEADQATFKNCHFYGWQDTLEAKAGRQYYVDCYIEGCTDFIFGNNATAFFKNCEIHSLKRNSTTNNGYVFATKGFASNSDSSITYGYIFYQCNFTGESTIETGTVSLGRPWNTHSKVAIIECTLGAHISKLAYGESSQTRYTPMSSSISPTLSTINFYEYNNTGDGAITESVAGCTVIDSATAANYTNFSVIFGTTNDKVVYDSVWDAAAALTALISLAVG